ncbi:MAG: hypothetical protein RLZZ196_1852, partial [Bacteroidota bacterium]
MENQSVDKFINSTPFPVTPIIDETILEEINNLEVEILGPGVIVFK